MRFGLRVPACESPNEVADLIVDCFSSVPEIPPWVRTSFWGWLEWLTIVTV